MVLADGALSIFGMLMSWLDKKCKALFFRLATQKLLACVLFGIFLGEWVFLIPAGNDNEFHIILSLICFGFASSLQMLLCN